MLKMWRLYRFGWTVEHVAGKRKVEGDEETLVVVCCVRNGAYYVEDFIEHYLELGAEHLIFLDNGSEDNTIELASGRKHVSVMRSSASFADFKKEMKRYLISRVEGRAWIVVADIDEFFSYPHADKISVTEFLKYLNVQGYDAVVAHLLDMFSANGSLKTTDEHKRGIKDKYKNYDLSSIDVREYDEYWSYNRSTLSSSQIKVYTGGVRKSSFGFEGCLTKHPLVRADRISPVDFDIHSVEGAYIADVSCVLHHYILVAGFIEKAERVSREESYFNNSYEYKKYIKKIKQEDDIVSYNNLRSIEQCPDLVSVGFLTTSHEYEKYVEAKQE